MFLMHSSIVNVQRNKPSVHTKQTVKLLKMKSIKNCSFVLFEHWACLFCAFIIFEQCDDTGHDIGAREDISKLLHTESIRSSCSDMFCHKNIQGAKQA